MRWQSASMACAFALCAACSLDSEGVGNPEPQETAPGTTTSAGLTTDAPESDRSTTSGTSSSSEDSGSSTSDPNEPTSETGEQLELVVAGELVVELVASDYEQGQPWPNTGMMGDFSPVGDPQRVDVDGVACVEIAFEHAFQSERSAPDSIVGVDPTRSIEVWAWNLDIAAEETLVAWGQRAADGTNIGFGFGRDESRGAVDHWGDNANLAWGGALPQAGTWHHLAYTFDGQTVRLFVDGDEAVTRVFEPGTIATQPGRAVMVGAQQRSNGNLGAFATVHIARVRVHSDALEPDAVRNNYMVERAAFTAQ